jgi:AraC-like DNA-binding protein
MLKSLGLVWIPGVMAGMMVSSASPLYAGIFQFIVVTMILAASASPGCSRRCSCENAPSRQRRNWRRARKASQPPPGSGKTWRRLAKLNRQALCCRARHALFHHSEQCAVVCLEAVRQLQCPSEGLASVVESVRKTLFAGGVLHIGSFWARPASDACGGVERQGSHALVLPVSGLFTKHEAPGRYLIGTPSHAVLFAANVPYRIGYPGAIGDRALILRFGEELAAEPPNRCDTSPTCGLLPAGAMMLRNLLWLRLQRSEPDAFESETLGLDLLGMSLGSMSAGLPSPRRSALPRRRRAVERVKEAVAAAPAERWSVAKLAKVASLSPFHLCHVFRETAGTSLYDYVLHERLAHSLAAVLDGGDNLTAIALDAGFASHSHFTARFRGFFGITPTALRRTASVAHIAQLRKIMTAARRLPA